MVRRGLLWMASLAPFICGAAIAACSGPPSYPPLIGGPHEAGGGGGGPHGGGEGGGSGNTPCFDQGYQCTASGNFCPVQQPYGCGSGSGEICCSGLNDAGAPDVGPQ